ncbi:hypothetical protein [Nitrosomonas sp.]|uniref:hypothetical protein n=1 Tax=Nitrosomonas sp. TaxID=42353 RepID=UPI0028470A43|nr:hypothetical protein [Nitrosomonas sp.]MDR4513122.1 hypothetical protein [Nitrosomonas sp.]
MSWKQQLIDVVFFSGLGTVLAKALPEHWQRRTNERLGDFNPYNAIAGNHDLMRAARLAWIKAALEVLNTAKECAQSSGREFGQKNEILRWISRQPWTSTKHSRRLPDGRCMKYLPCSNRLRETAFLRWIKVRSGLLASWFLPHLQKY